MRSLRSNPSNLEMILKYLEGLGYAVTVMKLKATDFGLPQRRSRLYFAGLRDSAALAESKQNILGKVADRVGLLKEPRDLGPASCPPYQPGVVVAM